MDRKLVVAVASVEPSVAEGRFQRHASPTRRKMSGSSAGGRWGPEGAYPVLYLGRPPASVVVEAYRHLVEPVEGMRPELVAPRRLMTAEVRVTNILDLRSADNRDAVRLSMNDLTSGVDDHRSCQAVGQAAHQLGLHGILAPAATGLGETLALFERRLPADEQPTIVSEEMWEGVPADPRQLRVVAPGNGQTESAS